MEVMNYASFLVRIWQIQPTETVATDELTAVPPLPSADLLDRLSTHNTLIMVEEIGRSVQHDFSSWDAFLTFWKSQGV